MNMSMVIDITRDSLFLTMYLAGPLLLVGLAVGLAIGIFQAVTQIHEMTLTFIPKILAVGAVFLLMLPWMLQKFMDFTINIFNMVALVGH
ncbi:MAG: flagellar biosynthetic protein FliQ [Elusimicrobia bacterium RIFOXYB2_FULL_49_7]|nr:MAG: flagellar biosynthetic protein FliQ [Elusimicrobia bacterium RIFOXYB2_FULL_49_7]